MKLRVRVPGLPGRFKLVETSSAAAAAAIGPACVLRGQPTGEKVACPSCGGKRVELFVFGCPLHAAGCTIDRPAEGKGCCASCPARVDPARAAAYDPTRPVVDPGSGAGPGPAVVPGDVPPSTAVLVTGGIGDAIAVEGMLTPEERDRLEAVYYAAPAAAEIEQLWRALPNYPRLKNHVTLATAGRVLYSQSAVEGVVGRLPAGVRDLSIATVFPQRLPYRGSSLLAHTLFARPSLPPAPYAVVLPHSTWYAPPGRNFDADDWDACFETLEKYDLTGVVLCRERIPVPRHWRLMDRQGGLSIRESVEVVKGAAGYLGIDSWASVLAAKLFPASRISVKCRPDAHARQWLATYYAPRTSFGFVSPRLEVPSWN